MISCAEVILYSGFHNTGLQILFTAPEVFEEWTDVDQHRLQPLILPWCDQGMKIKIKAPSFSFELCPEYTIVMSLFLSWMRVSCPMCSCQCSFTCILLTFSNLYFLFVCGWAGHWAFSSSLWYRFTCQFNTKTVCWHNCNTMGAE